MFLLKELLILAAILALASLGLIEFSNPYWQNSTSENLISNQYKIASNPDIKKEFSSEFYLYIDLIQNKPIDKPKIKSQISELGSDFEREYLTALLKKREGSFSEAYKILFSQLNKQPEYLSYYSELSSLAKISGTINKLRTRINSEADTSNNFVIYLKALTEYQDGNASQAIKIFQSLIEKGFLSTEIFYQLAQGYRTIGDYDKGFLNLIKAEEQSEENDQFLSKVYNLKGTLFFLSGKYEEAKREYESALKYSTKTGNKVEEIKALANLAIILDV
jgi:tetratricopeptide (TPR) repeat protein